MIWLILLSIVSAILYRLGGASASAQQREFPWIPRWFRRLPKKRDVGCTLCVIAGLNIVGVTGSFWAWFLTFGLMWGALSTYWDESFGYDNFYAHGFGVGIACFPLMFFGEGVSLTVRACVLALAVGLWSKANGEAKWEEMGRGALLPLTVGLVILI